MPIFEDEDEKGEPSAGEVIADLIQDLKPVFETLIGALMGLKEAVRSHTVSYDEVMKYFSDHQNDSPKIVKGALLKEETGDGFELIQVFLDKNNKPVVDKLGVPLGYRKKAKQLDDELLKIFKGGNLVIVE